MAGTVIPKLSCLRGEIPGSMPTQQPEMALGIVAHEQQKSVGDDKSTQAVKPMGSHLMDFGPTSLIYPLFHSNNSVSCTVINVSPRIFQHDVVGWDGGITNPSLILQIPLKIKI